MKSEKDPEDVGYTIVPVIFHEYSHGKLAEFEHPFDQIARSKVREVWFDQQDGGTGSISPHLLYSGDTPYWGGDKRHGMACACSGIEAYKDQAIARMTLDLICMLTHDAWMGSEDKAREVALLT